MPETDIRVVLMTAPDKETAESIASKLVEQQLAACVNILPGLTSIYRWEGRVETAEELLLVAKTSAERYAEFEKLVQALHPYDTPEVLALPVSDGLDRYLSWVGLETKKG